MIRTCPKCNASHRRSHAYCAECHAENMRTWRKTHPLTEERKRKDSARSYANVYLKRGKLQRGPCVDCGDDEAQMHHEDYSKPLEVIWLCRDCHPYRHQEE